MLYFPFRDPKVVLNIEKKIIDDNQKPQNKQCFGSLCFRKIFSTYLLSKEGFSLNSEEQLTNIKI
jgi:hypothetical protein